MKLSLYAYICMNYYIFCLYLVMKYVDSYAYGNEICGFLRICTHVHYDVVRMKVQVVPALHAFKTTHTDDFIAAHAYNQNFWLPNGERFFKVVC